MEIGRIYIMAAQWLCTPQRCRGGALCCASKLQVILFSSNPSTYLLLIEIAVQYSLFPLQSFICLIAEINWKLARYISHGEWYASLKTWYLSLERQNTFFMSRQATCITWYMSRRTYCIIFYLICICVGWSWARVGSVGSLASIYQYIISWILGYATQHWSSPRCRIWHNSSGQSTDHSWRNLPFSIFCFPAHCSTEEWE